MKSIWRMAQRNTLTFRPNQVKIEIIPKGHLKHFHKKIITER